MTLWLESIFPETCSTVKFLVRVLLPNENYWFCTYWSLPWGRRTPRIYQRRDKSFSVLGVASRHWQVNSSLRAQSSWQKHNRHERLDAPHADHLLSGQLTASALFDKGAVENIPARNSLEKIVVEFFQKKMTLFVVWMMERLPEAKIFLYLVY